MSPLCAAPKRPWTVFCGQRWMRWCLAIFWSASRWLPSRLTEGRGRGDTYLFSIRSAIHASARPDSAHQSLPGFVVHILLLNQYFPPDTSATAKIAAMVAEALAERHRVTVLAGRPSYDPSERHPYYLWRREVRGNLTVERVGSTTYPRFQMWRRVSNYLSYLALAVPRALAIRADMILAMTDPPVEGIAGAIVAKLTGRPFVYNIQDLYPDMALGGAIVPPSPWVEIWESLHQRALRRAALVIVLGEDMRERIIAKGVDPARVVIVRD